MGYDDGYQDGVKDGYKRGYDEAYPIGTVFGYRQGYAAECASAIIVSRERGYEAEYEIGIEVGRDDGLSSQINLHEPSYAEVVDFLRRDKTNLKPYLEDEYICTDYCAEVNNNAEAKGIQCILVFLAYKDNKVGHAIISFNTTDKGTIYVEPQTDEIIEPAEEYNLQDVEEAFFISLLHP